MTLPAKIQKPAKRDSRWRSPSHCKFVRGYACCKCGSTAGIEAAHVRLGSNTGMGRKPDDWRVVSLCHDCHNGNGKPQHSVGERTFWKGIDVEGVIKSFIAASPKRAEIHRIMKERGL